MKEIPPKEKNNTQNKETHSEAEKHAASPRVNTQTKNTI